MFNTMLASLAVKYAELKARPESGQGLVEYALILVLISLVAIVFMTNVGGDIVEIFTGADNSLESAAPAAPAS
jgi:pilus assembly protein Flp/PilA